MFAIDAFTKIKATDTKWLVVFRAFVSILLIAGFLIDVGFQISDIVTGATFFQTSEVPPNQDPYIYYIPNFDFICDRSLNLSVIPSLGSNGEPIDQALPPIGSVYLSCLLHYNDDSLSEDCSKWKDHFRTSKKIPYVNAKITFTLYLSANHSYTNNMLAGISFWLWDPDFDPYINMNSADFQYFSNNSVVEGVPLYNNIFSVDLSLGYAIYIVNYHKVITKRNMVGRNGWNTFLNYIGKSVPDTAILLNVNSVTQTGTGNTVTIMFDNTEQTTITVQDEVRVHTVSTLLSSVGGLYSVLAGIYVVFFGKLPESPWGIIQRINFYLRGYSVKKEVENKIEDNFGTSSGIPLVDEVKWPKSEDLSTRMDDMANRQIALENILNEFFVDAGYLKSLRDRSDRGYSSLSSNV